MSECTMELNADGRSQELREQQSLGGSTQMKTLSSAVTMTVIFLCLLGIGVSIELTRIHIFVHTDSTYHSICAMSEGVNCETVAISPYSIFGGLPVSIWGIGGYAIMCLLALSALSRKRLHLTWPWGFLAVLASLFAAISAALAFISITRIDSICLFCTASYSINAMLLVLCIIVVKRLQLPVLQLLVRDINALLSRPRLSVPLGIAGIGTIVLLQAFVPPYWESLGWTELPRLASGTDTAGHHWIGASNPRLTIVEFSDYQCPHCRAAHKDIRLRAAQHADEIRVVHRHLPLDMACHPKLRRPFHARACLFAEAAECAALQGQFWEMNDALFSIQETVKTEKVDPLELAVRLGLNRSEFKQCLESHATADRVTNDLSDAMSANLSGTPSFLIGEQLFMGRIPEPELQRLLQNRSQ